MEFLAFWIGSSVISLGMQFSNKLRLFKDISDNGYKFDFDALKNFNQEENSGSSRNTHLVFLIPMINIWYALIQTLQYDNIRMNVLDKFRIMGVLSKMTDLEWEEYSKIATGFNALLLPYKVQLRLEQAEFVRVKIDDVFNDFYFEKTTDRTDVIILQINGPVADLSIVEQKKILFDILLASNQFGVNVEDRLKVVNSDEDKKEKLRKEDNLNDTVLPISIEEKKQNLENLKQELLSGNENSQSISESAKLKLVRRKSDVIK